ncbi:MAG: DUF1445 domain-containing protein [Pseudonocardia sp.]|nr:DUF1445 domain-containing protein [Pseudonocardia sp.]
MTPAQARARFRAGLVTPTTGWCDGITQTNLITVPRAQAWDFLLFAQRNPQPCPVLDVLDAGAVAGPLLDGDVRTDIPLYRVYVDGEQVAETPDVRDWWRDDLVSFLVGCSHVRAGARGGRGAGAVSGPLVVSMRYVPAALVETAVAVTARYPAVHGAPVHAGDPRELGIADLDAPDYGDAVRPEPGDVPVFWACGVTPQAAVVVESRPPLAIAHAPGHMLITDARDDDYLI